ncbi:MAG: ABC transporter [Novosphingobium sp.]
MLRPDAEPHWAREVLARRGVIAPLDRLVGPELARIERLVIAQPRPLAPDENVALDAWVRGGGHVLLFADPALTEPSAFGIGDPRRPQDLVLLSPILGRWGLALIFDEDAPGGERSAEILGMAVPLDRAGVFHLAGANCRLWGEGVAASCRVGKGRVVALADAAVLGRDDPDGARARALDGLLDSAFAAR